MKKLITICAVVMMMLVLTGMVQATPDWKLVPFNSIIGGAVSYDASGDNVVVDETAFYDKVQEFGNPVSFQKVGGDGIDNPVVGNFAFFGAFNYTDSANVFGWAQGIATTPLAIEIGAHTLHFGNGASDYFVLDAVGMPNYLTASLAELGARGCTEIADNIWMDIAVDAVHTQVAISIVMDGYFMPGYPDINTSILAGDLDGQIGNWRASGIRLAEIPEPATIAVLCLGGLLLRRKK